MPDSEKITLSHIWVENFKSDHSFDTEVNLLISNALKATLYLVRTVHNNYNSHLDSAVE